MKTNSSSIVCQDLSYQVAGTTLVDKINCQFEIGKISAVLGKNGAGKSTLLALLSKELEATSGDVLFAGTSLHKLTYRQLAKTRAVLPQLQSLVFSIEAQQLVQLGAEIGFSEQNLKSCEDKIKQVVSQVMLACDIQSLAKRDVLTLSGGEQKRVQLARVLAQIWPLEKLNNSESIAFKNRWLLLDEWTNGLDLEHQQTLAKLFKEWSASGLGIVMVLHDINLALNLADDVKLLKNGELLLTGQPKTVFTSENIQQVLDAQVWVQKLQNGQTVIVPT